MKQYLLLGKLSSGRQSEIAAFTSQATNHEHEWKTSKGKEKHMKYMNTEVKACEENTIYTTKINKQLHKIED